MKRLSEKTPLMPEQQQVVSAGKGSPTSSPQAHGAGGTAATSVSPPPTPAKARLRKLHSAPIKDLLSTGMDVESLRLSYAAKLVLAAVEGRHVESAVDLLLLKGGFANPLCYPLYSPILVCIILVHLALALWEGGMYPFPLSPAVAAAEVAVSICYVAHILLNLWTFGVKQYRDKKWQFAFTVLAIAHLLLMVLAAVASAHSISSAGVSTTTPAVAGAGEGGMGESGGINPSAGIEEGEGERDWWNISRLALLGAQALRPMMLISNLTTIRRVFTNVLRTLSRTGSILTLGAVVIAFYSVVGINLFNSEQVDGYTEDGDNFDNFGSALLALFVLVTEENFPMVADPSFSQRPLVAFPFFVSFLLLFLVVMLPLLLGIVLDAYAQQHAHQHERYRRKARNALLAAYFILDDDGVDGLSREQLVGVLTTEAGVGIDRDQAEQLWNMLAPEDDDRRNGFVYSRSYSVPVENDTSSTKPSLLPAPAASANTDKGSSNPNNGTSGNSSSSTSNAAKEAFRIAARSRARSLPHSRPRSDMRRGDSGRSSCRLGVRGFLRLADLLHEKVVEAGEGDGHGGRAEERACYLAGFEGDEYDGGVGAGFSPDSAHGTLAVSPGGRGRAGIRESESDEEEDDSGDEYGDEDDDEESASGEQCCFSGDEGARAGGAGISAHAPPSRNSATSGGGGGSNGTSLSPWQRMSARMERCATCSLSQVRRMSRIAVGREWFSMLSKAIAVGFVLLALAWTPLAQQRYDDADGGGCLEGGRGDCDAPDGDGVDYQWENLLRRLRGLVLLAFLGEMAVKVVAVGYRRLWRLHWAHRFDLILLGMYLASYLSVGVPGNTRALYVDRHPALSDVIELPRAVAVLRLVSVFPQLRRLVETMSAVAAMLLKIMVLYSCVSYTFAAVGMAIFADAKSDVLDPRYSFSTLPEASMALFFMTVSNNWNDLLYPLVNSVKAGRWSAIYFVSYMLFCATMMLDVLVGVVIEGFRVSTKGPEQATTQKQLAPGGSRSRTEARRGAGNGGGYSGAGSNSGDSDGDGGTISGNSVISGDEEHDTDYARSNGGTGASQHQQQGRRAGGAMRRPPLTRKPSQRKYTQVKAEDMFRPETKAWRAQGVWDEEDVRELDEAVKTVERRLHHAWVSHVRSTGFVGEKESV